MVFYEGIITELERLATGGQFKNPAEMAKFLDVPVNQITRWIKRERVPRLDIIGPVLDKLGIKPLLPNESRQAPREVCFVEAKVLGAAEDAKPPRAEKYFAVPLAEGPVAAGPGLIPMDRIKGWILVWRYHPALRHISGNLVCVEIGANEHSMEPTLHPRDLVLIHKDKTEIERNRLYLVRDPLGQVKVKRVAIVHKKLLTLLVYNSDNCEYEAEPYILEHDFDGDLGKAIIGKVIWSWSDMNLK